MKKLNSNHLKLIAIIAMTIDHLTWLAFPGCQKIWYVMLLHIVGRLTAPIMWFFIVEGYNQILEWVASPWVARGCFGPRDPTHVSCIASRFFTN